MCDRSTAGRQLPSPLAHTGLAAGDGIAGVLGTLLFWQATTEAQVGWGVFLVGAWLWLFTSLTFDRLGQLLDDGQRRRLWPLMTLLIALGFGLFSLLTASLARTRLDQLIVAGLILMVLQLMLMVLQGVGRRLAR